MNKLFFSSDYQEGCHQSILDRLASTNMEHTAGYGLDPYSDAARGKIRKACNAPEAEIFFLVGGTQANATVIDCMLRPYQGVLAASSGHVSIHEAGAIEHGGHKVLELSHKNGKINAAQIDGAIRAYNEDANHDHMVMPGMVYISQPTEYGTLYSKAELTAISKSCKAAGIPLYVDGARLAYGLATPANDVTLEDLATLADIFYIGGTKCGALFGEAVVIPKAGLIPHFFSMIKQHGALVAKGRILGLQFDTLFAEADEISFEDNKKEALRGAPHCLYGSIGRSAIFYADRIREALKNNGFELCFDSPTNQVFFKIEDSKIPYLEERVEYGFWEKPDSDHTIIRFATSWATQEADVESLLKIIPSLR